MSAAFTDSEMRQLDAIAERRVADEYRDDHIHPLFASLLRQQRALVQVAPSIKDAETHAAARRFQS